MDKEKNKLVVVAAVALVAGVVGGYVFGAQNGYKRGDSAGYTRAEADVKKFQEETAQKATEEVAKATNPFSTTNPLENVEANPFEKAKKVLNPFQ